MSTEAPSFTPGLTNRIPVSRGTPFRSFLLPFPAAVPPRPHAIDYEIKTADSWNFAIVPERGAIFNRSASKGWTPSFAFDDSNGVHPFSIKVFGRRVDTWGFWRGSNITDVPPASPVECGRGATPCSDEQELSLVPFGSTNIRISVFPWTHNHSSERGLMGA